MGIVLMTAKQFASSFQCFVSAVSLRPDSAESYMLLASAYYYIHYCLLKVIHLFEMCFN